MQSTGQNKMRNRSPLYDVFFLFLLFSISSCAGKQWTDTLEKKEAEPVETLFYQMRDRDAQCPCCLNADIAVSLGTPMEKKSIGGFLQLMDPSNIKFIMTNPLGQPVFAFVINGRTFQSINTIQRKYLSGSLDSFMLHHDIPLSLLSNNWADYLAGRLQQGPLEVVEIRNDREKRGVWITIRFTDGDKKRKNYLLIDTVEKKLLTRIIVDEQDTSGGSEQTVAIITYDGWLSDKNCPIPTRLRISGFSFGYEIDIQLTEISTDAKLDRNTFKIKPPPGYLRQFLP